MQMCPFCLFPIYINSDDCYDGEVIECDSCARGLEIVFLEGGGIGLDMTDKDWVEPKEKELDEEEDFWDDDFDDEDGESEQDSGEPGCESGPKYWCLDRARGRA